MFDLCGDVDLRIGFVCVFKVLVRFFSFVISHCLYTLEVRLGRLVLLWLDRLHRDIHRLLRLGLADGRGDDHEEDA